MKISLTIVYYVVKKWCALIKRKKKKTHLNIQCDLWHKEEKIIDICGQMEFVFFGILKEKFDKQEMI